MIFGQLLKALKAKGRTADAARYERLVREQFKGKLSQSQLEQLDVNQIVDIIHLTKIIQPPEPTPLERYVLELQSRGFTVSIGERYK